MNILKAERDMERAKLAFASLDSDESGRYGSLNIILLVEITHVFKMYFLNFVM